MAKEIERKFLVNGHDYRRLADNATRIRQAYLSTAVDATVRVRIAGNRAMLTVKGRNHGAVRDEWEYTIPVADAEQMLERCAQTPVIDKTRYRLGPWEIDEFHGRHEGLVMAEIELPAPDAPLPPLPAGTPPGMIGREVTGDPAYYNSTLAKA